MSGLTDKIRGNVKQVAGAITDNDELKAKGKFEEMRGDVKSKVADAENHISEKIDEVKGSIRSKSNDDAAAQ
jgi:uncharacterized protein YjbJ (UPF0337 family)